MAGVRHTWVQAHVYIYIHEIYKQHGSNFLPWCNACSGGRKKFARLHLTDSLSHLQVRSTHSLRKFLPEPAELEKSHRCGFQIELRSRPFVLGNYLSDAHSQVVCKYTAYLKRMEFWDYPLIWLILTEHLWGPDWVLIGYRHKTKEQ
jgi:hypothetical protein